VPDPSPERFIVIMGSDVISLLAIQIAKLYSPAAIVFMAFRQERLDLGQEARPQPTLQARSSRSSRGGHRTDAWPWCRYRL